ncbi:MAG: NAD(P)/FAD-dependent oxidoreductase [Candidatus Hodarchaeales archaeon]
MDFIIIGNGVAGITAAQTLAKEASAGSKITMFSSEEFTYYPRPKLIEFLRKDLSIEDTISYDEDWYLKRKIDLHLNEKIIRIEPELKRVISDKSSYSYDRLLLSTGAACFCPIIPGMDLDNFYTLRSLKDAISIKQLLQKNNNVVIIGGGILGIEIASACADRGLNTNIVEYFRNLLPRQLDSEGGRILKKLLERNKAITFFLNSKVIEITGDKHVESVKLHNGATLEADMVIACTGIAPRIDLAKESGLKVNRAVIVNDYLETSAQDIFAAGDIAEHRGIVYGIIPPSIEQARIAAKNMVKDGTNEYTGSNLSTTIKVTDLLVTSIGFTGREEELNYKQKSFIDLDKSIYVKIFVTKDIIKSVIIIGTRQGIALFKKIIEQSYSDNEEKILDIFPDLR